MHLASHVCCHYTPLSPLTEGWGTVTDLSSVPLKRTTDNFASEGLNMHERPKRVRAGGRGWLPPLCDPLSDPKIQTYTHTYTHTLPSSNRWEHVSEGERRAPPSLFYHPHCWGQLGGRHSFFSAFRGKQKSVWDPSYTHVHVFRQTHTHTHNPSPKKLSMQLWADHISAAWACQPAEVWVLSLGHLLKVKVREIIPTLLTRAGVLICW